MVSDFARFRAIGAEFYRFYLANKFNVASEVVPRTDKIFTVDLADRCSMIVDELDPLEVVGFEYEKVIDFLVMGFSEAAVNYYLDCIHGDNTGLVVDSCLFNQVSNLMKEIEAQDELIPSVSRITLIGVRAFCNLLPYLQEKFPDIPRIKDLTLEIIFGSNSNQPSNIPILLPPA